MLNHRIRGLLFLYKKTIVFLQLASILGARVFRNIFIPSVRMTFTMSKMFARWYAEPLNERLIILLQQMLFWLLFSILFSSAGLSSSSAIVAPFASAGIRTVAFKPVKPGHYRVLRPHFARSLDLIW